MYYPSLTYYSIHQRLLTSVPLRGIFNASQLLDVIFQQQKYFFDVEDVKKSYISFYLPVGLKKPENCGNEELHERVEEAVANLVSVDMSDNIREILGDSIFDDEVIHVVVNVDSAEPETALKRQRLNDNPKEDLVSPKIRSSPVYRVTADDIKTWDVVAFLLYEFLWRQDTLSELMDITNHDVPSLEISGPGETGGYGPSTAVTASFINFSKIPGWPRRNPQTFRSRFLIRDEFKECFQFLEENKSSDIMLLGQPGIGKTIFLEYCLARRLVSGRRTILSFGPDMQYLFQESGVYSIPEEAIRTRADSLTHDYDSDALILFDANYQRDSLHHLRTWRTLAVPSTSNPLSGWEKNNQPKRFYMKTWDWKEIYVCRDLFIDKRTDDEWRAAFIQHGGTARNLLRYGQSTLEYDTGRAVHKCTSREIAHPMYVEYNWTTDYIVQINPVVDPDSGEINRGFSTGKIVSQYVFEWIMRDLGWKLVNDLESSFNSLVRDKPMVESTEVIFVGVGHKYLLDLMKSEFAIRSLSGTNQETVLNLSHVKEMSDYKVQEGLDNSKYYRALTSILPGVDSFVLELDEDKKRITGVVLFRFVITERCPINPGFLKHLWSLETIDKTTKWKFIFVVPERKGRLFYTQEESKEFEERLQIWETESDVWSERVEQFVLKVPQKSLWDAVRKK